MTQAPLIGLSLCEAPDKWLETIPDKHTLAAWADVIDRAMLSTIHRGQLDDPTVLDLINTWVNRDQVTSDAAKTDQDLSPLFEVTVKIVDSDESQALNHQYRGKDYPTNVLSFPNGLIPMLAASPEMLPKNEAIALGDLAICAPIVMQEANDQAKPLYHHWAHLLLHGILHLLGFDHEGNTQAAAMEKIEIQLLSRLAIDNPYEIPAQS